MRLQTRFLSSSRQNEHGSVYALLLLIWWFPHLMLFSHIELHTFFFFQGVLSYETFPGSLRLLHCLIGSILHQIIRPVSLPQDWSQKTFFLVFFAFNALERCDEGFRFASLLFPCSSTAVLFDAVSSIMCSLVLLVHLYSEATGLSFVPLLFYWNLQIWFSDRSLGKPADQ